MTTAKFEATITDSFGKEKKITNIHPESKIGDYLYTCQSCNQQLFLGDLCPCGSAEFPGIYEVEKASNNLKPGRWYFRLDPVARPAGVALVLVDYTGRKHGCGNILRMNKHEIYRHGGVTSDAQLSLGPDQKVVVN